jgi:GT2 family glycosyltransferase
MDAHTSAPPVVAVVITSDPGPWLEENLAALRAQDYPNLSVLVIDAGSSDDPTPRVASVLPRAYVRRLRQHVGYATAINEVLETVEGASHYLFCHDDVAPDPDVVTIMLEESFRSNAAVVTPKLVDWDQPDRLLQVGESVDKTGVPAGLADRGELDQSQHDSVRDVFCAPGGCTLVRADLFKALGGLDPDIDLFGDDINLSWRVQVAGGRIVAAPAARVRHLEAIRSGRRPGWEGKKAAIRAQGQQEVHRIRTLFTCYSLFHLLRVLPQALILSLAQAAIQLSTGRGPEAVNSAAAWPRALRRPRRLLRARRQVQRHRSISDSEVRRMQMRGSARIRDFIRSLTAPQPDEARHMAAVPATRAPSANPAQWRIPLIAWCLVVVVVLIGTRGLLGRQLPAVAGMPVTSGGVSHWWRLWFSGWRPDGLGSPAAAPPALALLGLGGTVLLGGVGLLQQLLVIGPLFIGPLGVYRVTRPFHSALSRAAALVVYAAIPVQYNALGGGRWAGLVVYAVAPWLLAGLCRAAGDAPWSSQLPLWVSVTGLGVLTAVAAAFVPATLVVVALIGLGLLLGSVLAGQVRAGLRAFGTSLAVAAVAVVLLLPWSADVLASRTALFGVKLGAAGRLGLGTVLTFHTGRAGGLLIWAFLLAAALPLFIGGSWRLAGAARLWGVAVVLWSVVWAGSRGWLPVPMAVPEVFLAPAAAALALSVALSVATFELDLRQHKFGWRQLAPTAAVIAVAIGSLPALAAAAGGRWHVPRRDFSSTLSFLHDPTAHGAYRVLWLGDPQVLPLGSWWLEDSVGFATSESGMPDVTNQWPPPASGATPLLASDLRLARAGLTTNLGHLLAPMAVRYLVVPSRLAPSGSGAPLVAVPHDLLTALGLQVDLRTVQTDGAVTVYENAAWAAERMVLPPAAVPFSQASGPSASQNAPLAGAPSVLPGSAAGGFKGPVPAGDLLISQTANGRWQLTAAGQPVKQSKAFGWAMAFTIPGAGGPASLHYRTPVTRSLFIGVEGLLWLVALGATGQGWRRRSQAEHLGPDLSIPAEWLEEDQEERAPVTVRRRPRRVAEPVGVEADELWTP